MLTSDTIDTINALSIGDELTLPDGRRIRVVPSADCYNCAFCHTLCGSVDCCGDFRADGSDVSFAEIPSKPSKPSPEA